MDLDVISLPDPEPTIGGHPSGDSISKAILIAQSGIIVPVPDGWHFVQIQNKQRIVRYSVKVVRNNSPMFEQNNIEGFLFSRDLLEFIRKSIIPGDEVTFFNIDTILYNKERRYLKEPFKLFIK